MFNESTYLILLDLSYNDITGHLQDIMGNNSECLGNISFDSSTVPYIPEPLLGLLPRIIHIKNSAQIYKEDQQVNFTTKKRFEMGDLLFYMSGMDLSDSELKGNIPPELGNLTNIRSMNLSHNHLSGQIPARFSNLKNIESLDLSFNRLTSEISPQLTELTFLAVFSLAYNNLSGRTPERENQFITFDEEVMRVILFYVDHH
ncbi:hypothetical protein L6164_002813 [Bauhinia variegata]|uniref:Uncharacterized protein n=1 Tax=Bauhinia variegata TaxID=167791 RepID=A0ACB9PYS7_BAUVA|nr:hypothetical protein L6164_002813 [Bauhinia variegata]